MKQQKSILITLFLLLIVINTKSQEIFEAVRKSDISKVRELIEKNANVIDSKTSSGMSILHEAVNTGEIAIVKELIDLGLNINDSNNYGWTALHIAAAKGDRETTELLINNGALINIRTRDGYSPFNLASETGQEDVIELLLARGADSSPIKFPVYKDEYFGQKKPDETAKPFAAGIFAPRHNYYVRSITFTPEGKECYWSVIDLEDKYRRWIVGSKIENGKWTLPQIAPFSKKGFEDDVPCISPDGNMLLFISMRPIEGVNNEHKENIWMMRRNGDTWSTPKPLPDVINKLGNIHQQLSLDQNNNLYFACSVNDESEDMDIYCSKYLNGEYQKPINLGSIINGQDAEWAPFISPDASYLIYTRIIANGWTLFISFKKKDNSWTAPIELYNNLKLKEVVNLGGPFVTRDNKYLIFFRNKETSIPYWVKTSFIEKMRPMEL